MSLVSGYFAESPAVHSIDVKNVQIKNKKKPKNLTKIKKNFSKRNKKRYLFLV